MVLARIFHQVALLLDHLHSDRMCLGEMTVNNIEVDLDNVRIVCLCARYK